MVGKGRFFARHAVALTVKVRTPGGWEDMQTVDVSRRGIFVQTREPIATHRIAQMKIEMPSGQVIDAMGHVRRVVEPDNDEGHPPGMGVEFFVMSKEAEDEWDTFVLQRSREEREHSDAVTFASEDTPLPGEIEAHRTSIFDDLESDQNNEFDEGDFDDGRNEVRVQIDSGTSAFEETSAALDDLAKDALLGAALGQDLAEPTLADPEPPPPLPAEDSTVPPAIPNDDGLLDSLSLDTEPGVADWEEKTTADLAPPPLPPEDLSVTDSTDQLSGSALAEELLKDIQKAEHGAPRPEHVAPTQTQVFARRVPSTTAAVDAPAVASTPTPEAEPSPSVNNLKSLFITVRPTNRAHLEQFIDRRVKRRNIFLRSDMACAPGQGIDVALVHPVTDVEMIVSGVIDRGISSGRGPGTGFLMRFNELESGREGVLRKFIKTGRHSDNKRDDHAHRAAELSERAADNPRSFEDQLNFAWGLITEGERPADAVEPFLTALALAPTEVEVHLGLSLAYALSGDTEKSYAFVRSSRQLAAALKREAMSRG
ncbi:MAG: PilZ domain-containing protein [Myxococcales bacterium]|nr:PilZ domain-containing protein [Myxococcales bacterium]